MTGRRVKCSFTVLNSNVIESTMVTKKNPKPAGEEDGHLMAAASDSGSWRLLGGE